MAIYHFTTKPLSRGTRNTVGAIAYRAGCELRDLRTVEVFDYGHKPVQHVELVLPKEAPEWAKKIQDLVLVDRQNGVQAFVNRVEGAETRINSRVWREFEFALHRELTDEQNIALAKEFVEDQICGRGMSALLNFHLDRDEETGGFKPHCHVTATTRRLDETGMGAKERDWNKKELLFELREQWAHYSNFHLKLHGHDVQIDHRSYYDRGIEIEPQPKRGKSVIEQEKKTHILGIPSVTDKQKAFEEVKLKNLYRILRRPEVVLEIVTKHHATFMWADVQKVLHRYIDDLPLFQKMESRLKNSSELIVLQNGKEKETEKAYLKEKSLNDDISDKAIYTTKSMLKTETSLVEIAKKLDRSMTHWIERNQMERSMIKSYQKLGIMGGLSVGQERAIQHLVGMGQLKCVVGIAGSGKTTLLSVCHDVWASAGYNVYGLAPTGKAAQNLEQSGIKSTTVHKFLKEFESGRCQYQSQSVLVLDEAGMVDVERFSSLLNAVQQLKVKLVVVGDGAQLQPVEAGPAFRLITERIGKKELTTVLRQREDWQKDATLLFGKLRTVEALKKYMDKGHVHIVEEKLPYLEEAVANKDYENLVKLYEVSNRVSSLMYREMIKDIRKPEYGTHTQIPSHPDYNNYLKWKDLEKESAKHILENSQACKIILEERSINPLKIAMLFTNKEQPIPMQHQETQKLIKDKGLEHLIGIEKPKGQSTELRYDAKKALLSAWHSSFQESPEKSSLILAFTNKDVTDLNKQARFLLKTSGHLDKEEFTYSIKREKEDDFGKKRVVIEEKGFSKGDRIVFTRNNYGLGVKNGTIGTITELTQQKIHARLDDGKDIAFAPKLNPFFDHGWAITIHKSQGTTIDKTYVLASADMTQNLAYVAMTRHRDDVQVYGSSLDFWRKEKLPEMLSKSGEKLSAADYLDAHSLEELMRKEDHLITKIFKRISNELEAIGAVSKYAFWQAANHFLRTSKESEIKTGLDLTYRRSIREETRAEEMLKEKTAQHIADKDHLDKEHIEHGVASILPTNSVPFPEPGIDQKLVHEKNRDYGPSL